MAPSMNWTRGLFRIWLLGAVVWTGLIYLFMQKSPATDCRLDCDAEGYWKQAILWGLPLIVLAIGSLMRWALLGFRR